MRRINQFIVAGLFGFSALMAAGCQTDRAALRSHLDWTPATQPASVARQDIPVVKGEGLTLHAMVPQPVENADTKTPAVLLLENPPGIGDRNAAFLSQLTDSLTRRGIPVFVLNIPDLDLPDKPRDEDREKKLLELAVKTLRSQANVDADQVFIITHGETAFHRGILAANDDGHYAGLVYISPLGHKFGWPRLVSRKTHSETVSLPLAYVLNAKPQEITNDEALAVHTELMKSTSSSYSLRIETLDVDGKINPLTTEGLVAWMQFIAKNG